MSLVEKSGQATFLRSSSRGERLKKVDYSLQAQRRSTEEMCVEARTRESRLVYHGGRSDAVIQNEGSDRELSALRLVN